MRFWIEWEAIYEGFIYSESVNERELAERLSDETIKLTKVEELPD